MRDEHEQRCCCLRCPMYRSYTARCSSGGERKCWLPSQIGEIKGKSADLLQDSSYNRLAK